MRSPLSALLITVCATVCSTLSTTLAFIYEYKHTNILSLPPCTYSIICILWGLHALVISIVLVMLVYNDQSSLLGCLGPEGITFPICSKHRQ